jgi:hypothetical protein
MTVVRNTADGAKVIRRWKEKSSFRPEEFSEAELQKPHTPAIAFGQLDGGVATTPGGHAGDVACLLAQKNPGRAAIARAASITQWFRRLYSAGNAVARMWM